MLPKPVPSDGGARTLVLTGTFMLFLEDDVSGEPHTLRDLEVGGGPGGGGGRGIPGSQARVGGDLLGD